MAHCSSCIRTNLSFFHGVRVTWYSMRCSAYDQWSASFVILCITQIKEWLQAGAAHWHLSNQDLQCVPITVPDWCWHDPSGYYFCLQEASFLHQQKPIFINLKWLVGTIIRMNTLISYITNSWIYFKILFSFCCIIITVANTVWLNVKLFLKGNWLCLLHKSTRWRNEQVKRISQNIVSSWEQADRFRSLCRSLVALPCAEVMPKKPVCSK